MVSICKHNGIGFNIMFMMLFQQDLIIDCVWILILLWHGDNCTDLPTEIKKGPHILRMHVCVRINNSSAIKGNDLTPMSLSLRPQEGIR